MNISTVELFLSVKVCRLDSEHMGIVLLFVCFLLKVFTHMCLLMWQAIVNNMKKKQYSFLDHRRNNFDVDYQEFCKSTSELHVSCMLKSQMQRKYLIVPQAKTFWVICHVFFLHQLSWSCPETAKEFHGNHTGKNSQHRGCPTCVEEI